MAIASSSLPWRINRSARSRLLFGSLLAGCVAPLLGKNNSTASKTGTAPNNPGSERLFRSPSLQLEIEAKSKLQVSHSRVGCEAEDAPCGAAVHAAIGVPEVNVVE